MSTAICEYAVARIVNAAKGNDWSSNRPANRRLRVLTETLTPLRSAIIAIAAKCAARAHDEAAKPLAAYREEELTHMRRNFYGFDPSYHIARHHFVRKSPASWTPRHLARHRELGWSIP